MHPSRRHRRSYRVTYGFGLGLAGLALAGCAGGNVASRSDSKANVAAAPSDEPAAKTAKAKHRTARATLAAIKDAAGYSAVGVASWYGADFHGRETADGERFDMHALTAAHRTLPMQCTVRVTNLANNRSVLVRVNDRGPFAGNRLIDLSAQSAKVLGFYDRGVTRVKVDYVGPARPVAPRVTASAAPL